jgi:hypothetical protein
MAEAANFSQAARGYQALRHTVAPTFANRTSFGGVTPSSFSAAGSFGRSTLPPITTTSTDAHGTSSILNNAGKGARKLPKSGLASGRFESNNPLVGLENAPGDIDMFREPGDDLLIPRRQADGPDDDNGGTEWWEPQRGLPGGPSRPQLPSGNMGTNQDHPLMTRVRAALEAPRADLGGIGSNRSGGPDEPLQGVVLPRVPTLGGPAANFFAEP